MGQRTDRSSAVVSGFSFPGGADASSPTDSTSQEDGRTSLASLLKGCRFFCGDDVKFTGLAESADKAMEGQLVVYRIGQDCPSQLVADALARGAAGILTEQILPCPLPQAVVADVDVALAKITAEQCGRPDRKLLTVGVIGSAGKTTTTLLVSSLLRGCGIRTAYQSDLGESDGVVQSTSEQSVPSGIRLVEWIAEASDSQSRAAIIELSEDAARHGQYDAIEFDLLVVTGSSASTDDFGPAGLDCALERLAEDGVVVVPADDPKAERMVRDSGAQMVTYGVRKAADVTAKIIDQSGGMTTLLVTHENTTAVMETSLCGAAMAANHAASVVVGLLIAQPLEEIVEKLSQLRSVPGRGQRLESFGHASVVIDAGGSPERVAAALRTYRSMKSRGKLWCVLAIDSQEEPERLAIYGSLMERFADHAIVTSRRNKKAKFLSASHGVLDGVQECAAFRMVADRKRAVEWALGEASPNDTILAITGEPTQSAVGQRTDIEGLCKLVESIRESNEPSEAGPPQFKIVG